MKRLGYGDSWWMVGDSAAEAVLELAVTLARHETAASIDLAALDAAGSAHTVSFLVGPATMMSAETITSSFSEPDNDRAVAAIHAQIERIASPPNAVGAADSAPGSYFEDM